MPQLHLLGWDDERRLSDRPSHRQREPDPEPAESLDCVESCPRYHSKPLESLLVPGASLCRSIDVGASWGQV